MFGENLGSLLYGDVSVMVNMFNGSLFKGTVYMVFLFALQLQTTCFSQKLSKVNFDKLSSTANAT